MNFLQNFLYFLLMWFLLEFNWVFLIILHFINFFKNSLKFLHANKKRIFLQQFFFNFFLKILIFFPKNQFFYFFILIQFHFLFEYFIILFHNIFTSHSILISYYVLINLNSHKNHPSILYTSYYYVSIYCMYD